MKPCPTRNERLYGARSFRRRFMLTLATLMATTPLSAHATSIPTHNTTVDGRADAGVQSSQYGTTPNGQTDAGVTSRTNSSLETGTGTGNWMGGGTARPTTGTTTSRGITGSARPTVSTGTGITTGIGAHIGGVNSTVGVRNNVDTSATDTNTQTGLGAGTAPRSTSLDISPGIQSGVATDTSAGVSSSTGVSD